MLRISAVAALALDPTLLAVLSIFGGVVVTVLAGLVGAWIQGRREHWKWIREQRFAACTLFVEEADKLRVILKPLLNIPSKENFHLYDSLLQAEAQLSLLGPDALMILSMNVHSYVLKEQTPEVTKGYYSARKTFIAEARKVLGVRGAKLTTQGRQKLVALAPDELALVTENGAEEKAPDGSGS